MRRQKLAQCLLELPGLVHLGDDVAAADELAVREQLGDRRPVRQRRELLADARVWKDVDGGERDLERLQRPDRAGREAARRRLRGALHEQDHVVLTDRLGDRVADRVRLGAALSGRARGRGAGGLVLQHREGIGLALRHSGLLAYGVLTGDGVCVFSASAWIAPPSSPPKTSYTRRCCCTRLSPSKAAAVTVALKWSPPPV